MHKRNTILFFTTMLISFFAIAGCGDSQRGQGRGDLGHSKMMDIYYLSGRLGMGVDSVSKEKIIFSNTENKVILHRDIDQIYLNGEYVGPLGKVKKINGFLSVRADIENEIKHKLILKVKEPTVTIETPEPKVVENGYDCTVVIDAGHGGKDPGAIALHGFYEKTVNLDVAMQIASMLRDDSFDIIATRTDDKFIELEQRAAIANQNNADIFISIHADSCATATTNGFTVYVSRSASTESIALAQSINLQMAKTSIKSKGVRRADFKVLTHTRCPAVLIELGYLSNYWEAKQLKDKNMQNKLAGAIKAGIADYCREHLNNLD